MSKLLVSLSVVFLGCGQGVGEPLTGPVRHPVSTGETVVGVAHVAGAYQPNQGKSFLLAGALDAQALGARTLKLYLTPEYQTKYPGAWPQVSSLAELAATPAFEEVFALPFDTFVLTTYTFATGVGDPWRDSDNEALYRAEREEMAELARHLLTRWAGTGKRFILQNWEGDWAVAGSTSPTAMGTPVTAGRMLRWLQARQAGVAAARVEVGETGVEVVNAAEVNRVLDANERLRLVSQVLPHLEVDALSWSAWEALEVSPSMPVAEAVGGVKEKLTRGLRAIRAAAPAGTPVFLGELGFAENELPEAMMGPLMAAVMETCRAQRVPQAVYWQVYDNECRGPTCRGLWLIRPDGSPSLAAQALARFH